MIINLLYLPNYLPSWRPRYLLLDTQIRLCLSWQSLLSQQYATTVGCGQRTQHLRGHRKAICGQRTPEFIVARGHNIWETTKRLFTAGVRHSSLWPKATAIKKLQDRVISARGRKYPGNNYHLIKGGLVHRSRSWSLV